ncbi:hypothetical protein ACIRD2_28920 [Streptomyces sp. NPDC093595]|uniref:hypothetical protein n=1 Tax=Streptomyces sp. NPDC093595 TaxID=3366045 RepID=UPI00382F0880
MNALHQHLLDSYRSAQHGTPPPPRPGIHDWRVLRSVRDHRRLMKVLRGVPVRAARPGGRARS